MKRFIGLVVAGLVLVLGGTRVIAEEESAITPQEAREHIMEHYISIGKSLAKDNLKGVSDDAGHIIEMVNELKGVKCGTTEKEQKECLDRRNSIKSNAEKLKAENIEDVRTAYGDLSSALIDCLEKCSAPEKEHYVFYCSMVKKSWIQETKDVGNPYYGKKMLKCGELKKTIGGKSKETDTHTGHKEESGHEEHKHEHHEH